MMILRELFFSFLNSFLKQKKWGKGRKIFSKMYLSWLPLPVQRCSLSFCVQSCSLVYFFHVFLCIPDLSTVSDCNMFYTVFFPCMGSFNASCVSISDWEILIPFCCLIILLWHIIVFTISDNMRSVTFTLQKWSFSSLFILSC